MAGAATMNALSMMWRLLNQHERRQLVAMQLLSIFVALSTVSGMAAILPFFTVLAEPHSIQAHHLLLYVYQHLHFADETHFVIALGVAFALAVVVSNFVSMLGTLAIDRFAFRVGESLHTALFNEYLHRSYGFHLANHSALLTNNVLNETARVAAGILRNGLVLVSSVAIVVCIILAILFLNPLIAVLALLGLGASYGAIYAISRGTLRRNGEIETQDHGERARIVTESFGAIKELLLLQAQPLFVERFAHRCRSIAATIVSNLLIAQIPRYALESATACVLVGLAIRSSLRAEPIGPLIAQLTFIGIAIYRLLPALQQLFNASVKMRSDAPAFERIAEDLRLARARRAAESTKTAEAPWRGRPQLQIVLRQISFSHANSAAPAIVDLTLRIPAGAMVGFIGPNGSGKSTLIDILSGLLIPQSGAVEVDGVELDADNRAKWLAAIAYVPQSVYLCDASLAENVAFGVSAHQIDEERMREAIGLAQLDQCVAELPNGYREKLGERGARLSGGQRQRLGIARALYRQASLIIMDEATSALDAHAERTMTDMLAENRAGTTTVLIAHRLSALRHCDVIYEIVNGRIERSGTFQEYVQRAAGALTV
jgi:ATP-binding cassette, subfamily B, bacterial PglK